MNEEASPNGTPSQNRNSSDSLYVQNSAVSDRPAADDYLGFKLYVESLAGFLLDPATQPPFVLSIEGEWGSGKSSFMLQLKKCLNARARKSVTIEFNAWKYERQEELWAAFALTVTRSLRQAAPFFRRCWCDLRLYFLRLSGKRAAIALTIKLTVILALLVTFAKGMEWVSQSSYTARLSTARQMVTDATSPDDSNGTAKGQAAKEKSPGRAEEASRAAIKESSQPNPAHQELTSRSIDWLAVVIATYPWTTGVALFAWLIWKIPGALRKSIFEVRLEQYIDKPDYRGKAAFLDAFSDDFNKTIRSYAPSGGQKIFIFIDDLDRCEAPKAADLMQAINLMIGEESRLFFILGLDRTKVAASVAFKYRGIIPYIYAGRSRAAISASTKRAVPRAKVDPSDVHAFGNEFLEKFIQISFPIPESSNDDQARAFINSLVAPAAAPSRRPRNYKHLLTLFRKKQPAHAPNLSEISAPATDRAPFRPENGPDSEQVQDVLMLAREMLGFNPRRVKSFLNRYRLSIYIVGNQGLFDKDLMTGKPEMTPEQLGKFLTIFICYPEIIAAWQAEPSLLGHIEHYLTWHQSTEKERFDGLMTKPGLLKLLVPPTTLTVKWSSTWSLRDFPLAKVLTILPAVPAPPKRQSVAVASEFRAVSGTPTGSVSVDSTHVDGSTAGTNDPSVGTGQVVSEVVATLGAEPSQYNDLKDRAEVGYQTNDTTGSSASNASAARGKSLETAEAETASEQSPYLA